MSHKSLRSEGKLSDVTQRLWGDALYKSAAKFNPHVYIKNAPAGVLQHNFVVTDSITGKNHLDIGGFI
jgi:hypothetical protein